MFDPGTHLRISTPHGTSDFLVEYVDKTHVGLYLTKDATIRFKYPKAYFAKNKKLYRVIKQ